jgi:hypothetical protein
MNQLLLYFLTYIQYSYHQARNYLLIYSFPYHTLFEASRYFGDSLIKLKYL